MFTPGVFAPPGIFAPGLFAPGRMAGDVPGKLLGIVRELPGMPGELPGRLLGTPPDDRGVLSRFRWSI